MGVYNYLHSEVENRKDRPSFYSDIHTVSFSVTKGASRSKVYKRGYLGGCYRDFKIMSP